MPHWYRFLIVGICLSWLPAQAQNWRPFRPNGDVHAFRGTSADTVLTMRLDSAGVLGQDSVYYFNRILRRAGSNFAWHKARNNQFGQQMRYNAAQRTYVLFWDGGPTPVFTLDLALVLKPFARVGDTWTSMNTDVGVPTTLLSRGTAMLDGTLDSVATFRLGNGPGTQVVLSKSFGLVSAPRDLRFYFPGAAVLTLARRPGPAGLSYYNPLTLLDLQPGDELGYNEEAFSNGPFPCFTGQILRRVLSRQLTADSIIYVFQQQSRTVYSGAPGCSAAGTIITSVQRIRVAASRRTGQWQGSDLLLPLHSTLLAYGYKPLVSGTNGVLMVGHPIVSTRPGVPCGTPATLLQEALYRRTATVYGPGLDALARQERSAQGVGIVSQPQTQLVYTRRTLNGTVQTCGSRANFSLLLPTKAAPRAVAFQLYPNPATELATLTLPEPARTVTTIRLVDGLGRVVGSRQLAAGQTTATLPLQELAAGAYVVEVQAAGKAAQRLRLQHQQ